MRVPNHIKLPHSPVQRVPKWIWIPLHYLTWSTKRSPYVMHGGTLDSECCAVCQEQQHPQAFPSPTDASWGWLSAFTPPGQWWLLKGISALAKRTDEGQRTPRNKSLKLFQYWGLTARSWPDPDTQAGTAHCCHTWARPSGKHKAGDSFCTYKLYH